MEGRRLQFTPIDGRADITTLSQTDTSWDVFEYLAQIARIKPATAGTTHQLIASLARRHRRHVRDTCRVECL